jgi:hypothetical protein
MERKRKRFKIKTTEFKNIPIEVLGTQIFNFLELLDIIKILCVNKQFNEAYNYGDVKNNKLKEYVKKVIPLDFNDANPIDIFNDANPIDIKFIVNYMFSFEKGKEIIKNLITNRPKELNNLIVIDCSYSNNENFIDLSYFIIVNPNLRIINLYHSNRDLREVTFPFHDKIENIILCHTNVTEKSLSSLLINFPNLKEIDLRFCLNLSEDIRKKYSSPEACKYRNEDYISVDSIPPKENNTVDNISPKEKNINFLKKLLEEKRTKEVKKGKFLVI